MHMYINYLVLSCLVLQMAPSISCIEESESYHYAGIVTTSFLAKVVA